MSDNVLQFTPRVQLCDACRQPLKFGQPSKTMLRDGKWVRVHLICPKEGA